MEQDKPGSFLVHDEGSVRDIAMNVVEMQEEDNAFYVCDLRVLKNRVQDWRRELPRVTPFYAIKANTYPVIIETLAKEGFNFDCSNKREIQLVLKCGVDPSRILYANPAKQVSHLEYSKSVGITLMTFDCVEELHKISDKNSRLLLRFATGGQQVKERQLELKFGCPLADAEKVLRTAIKLGHTVVGVAFHLGCVPSTPGIYQAAIEQAKKLFDLAGRLGVQMSVLDIGGGMLGSHRKMDVFAEVSAGVRSALETHFPPSSGTTVIAEPGAFFATSPYTLAVKVVAKRSQLTTIDGTVREHHDIYVNESRENCIPRKMYKILDIVPSPLAPPYERPRSQLATLWGATCHPYDVFESDVPFFDVTVGEWLLMDNMGAYSMVKVSGFNGSGFPPVHYRTESNDVDRVSRILRAWGLSPAYCQAVQALGNSATSAEKPGALV
ncbi:ornithine decarboxylase-like [Haemaphysalis longicornis]